MIPPQDLLNDIEGCLVELLTSNPLATSSEAFVQNLVEFELVQLPRNPPYLLRIGINYHGDWVQHVIAEDGVLHGWNPDGDALGVGANAKMLLANYTIFPRDPDEHMLSDCKVGGASVPPGRFVRLEFKVRGWLGKTKNLDGKQLQKDIDLLGNNKADLLVWALSETAHLKWRGDGPQHQAERRTGCRDFRPLLIAPEEVGDQPITRVLDYRRVETAAGTDAAALWGITQKWTVKCRRVIASPASLMPGAQHFITFVWNSDRY